MRQSLKVALSLLISVILFSGFAVLAFTRLFSLVETDFLQPRIEAEYQSRLRAAAEAVATYHEGNFESLSNLATTDGAATAFDLKPDPAAMQRLTADIVALKTKALSFHAIRLISTDARRIEYSTLTADRDPSKETPARKDSPATIVYRPLTEADSSIAPERLVLAPGELRRLVVDAANGRFVYGVPVLQSGVVLGTAVLYVGTLDLASRLIGAGLPQAGGVVPFLEGGTGGILLGITPEERQAVLTGLQGSWAAHSGTEPFRVSFTLPSTGGAPERLEAFSLRDATGGFITLVVRGAGLEMSDWMKGLLLAVFFLTSFLVVYLLFNLRPDPLDVVSQRVKRFQIQLLEGLIGREGTADWGRWRAELESRRPELTRQLERGIGRVSQRQRPALDAYLEKSWNEILDLMASRSRATAAPAAIDVTRLESLIQQALKGASFVVPAQIIGGQGSAPAGAPQIERPRPAAIEVEELAAEEVEELQEAEPAEEIPGTPPAVPSPAEPPSSAEEEVGELEPVEELEGAEETPEAVPLEAAAPPPAPEVTVGGARAVAASGEAAEEAGAVEEIPEAEAVEEILEAEAVEEESAIPVAQARLAGEPAIESVVELPVGEVVGEAAAGPELEGELPVGPSFAEVLEELEPVQELQILPPLPEEAGLEFLHPAEEPGFAAAPEGATIDMDTKEAGEPARARKVAGAEEESDVEELEGLDETSEAGEEPWSDDDQRRELEGLAAAGTIRTWTIEQMQKVVEEARSAIIVEDGVYRIREEMYAPGKRPEGRGRQAEEEGGRPEGEGPAVSGLSGIVDLIHDAEGIDLAKVVGTEREGPSEPALLETVKAKVMRLKRGGIDYDEFLAAYPRSFSHTIQMKSIVEISRRVSAVSAALLLKGAEGWIPDLTVGLAERTITGLKIRTAEPLGSLFLAKRVALAVDRPPGEIRSLRTRLDTEDLRFTRKIMLLPATFRGQEAYLLLAFTAEVELSLENILSELQVQ